MAEKEYYLPGEQPPAVNRGTSTAPLPAVDWTTWSAQPEWKRNLIAALDAAPAVGGMGGDIAAGVLGMPLEALNAVFPGLGVLTHAGFTVAGGGTGGALGQGIREGGYRMLGLGDAPGTIGGASREQATMGALGQMAGPVVTQLARGAYESMLRPTVRQLRENPAVAKLAWDLNGVIPKTGEKADLRGLASASKAEADNLVAQHAGGRVIWWQQIDDVEQQMLKKYAKDATGDRANSVRAFFNDLRAKWNPNNNPNLYISFEDAMALKRSADELASPVYRSRLARTSPNAAKPDEYYQAAKGVADELRSTLNTLVPGLKPVNARTSQLQAAANVLEESSLPRKFNLFATGHGTNPLAAGVGAGTAYTAAHAFGVDPALALGLGGGATMTASHMLEGSKPQISQAYLFLGKNPFAQNVIRQLPRAVDGLLQYPMNQNTAPAWYGAFPSQAESPSATPRRPGDFYLPGELNP